MFFVLDDRPEALAAAKALPPSDDYKVITIPKTNVLFGSFPCHNSFSYMIGPMKVYDGFLFK